MEWTDETIVRLRALWVEGLSTAEIGRRLNISKNAVVGKAHRLSLPGRPSPIRRDASGAARPAAPRRIAGPTLPPLTSIRPVAARAPDTAAKAEPPAPRPPPAASRVVSVPQSFGRRIACCWPIGEPGTPNFRFCDGESAPGKPYCVEHAQLAYVRVRDRREDAA